MAENVKHISQQDFNSFIVDADRPVLVDFYADWCGPCKMQAPIIEQLADDIGDKAYICKANTDECMSACMAYGIASIPTLILFKGGEVVEKKVGLTSKAEIADMILKHI